jgi:dCTP deaminase
MILSDTEVLRRINNSEIRIEPLPRDDAWQAMTLEGHLSNSIYKIRSRESGGGRVEIDLEDYKTEDFADQFWEEVDPTPDGYFPIHAKEFRLAYTKEKLQLLPQSRVCAFVEGKSSLARIGLAIHLAPIIHCGFGKSEPKPVMLEIYNHSENTIRLRPGIRICQFLFANIDGIMRSEGALIFGNKQPRAA